MKSILIVIITLISIPTQELQLFIPSSQGELRTINISFPEAQSFVLCEFDRLVEGSVQIYINDEPTPQIINLGQQEQQFPIDPKVQITKIKISFQTTTDLWVRFQK